MSSASSPHEKAAKSQQDRKLRQNFERMTVLKERLVEEHARLCDSKSQLQVELDQARDELENEKKEKAKFGGCRADIEQTLRDRKRVVLCEVELERIRRLEDGIEKDNENLVAEVNEQRTQQQNTKAVFNKVRESLVASQRQLQQELLRSEEVAAATVRLEDERDQFEASDLATGKKDKETLNRLERRLKRARRAQRLARIGGRRGEERGGKEAEEKEGEVRQEREQAARIKQLQTIVYHLKEECESNKASRDRMGAQSRQLRDILDRMVERARAGSHEGLLSVFRAAEDERLEQTRCIQRCGEEQKRVEEAIRSALLRFDRAQREARQRREAARKGAGEGETRAIHADIMCRLARKEIRRTKMQLEESTELLYRLVRRAKPGPREAEVLEQAFEALGSTRAKERLRKRRVRAATQQGRRKSRRRPGSSAPPTPAADALPEPDDVDGTRAGSPLSFATGGLDPDRRPADGGSVGDGGVGVGNEITESDIEGGGEGEVSASLAQQMVQMAETAASKAVNRAAGLLLLPSVCARAVSVLRYLDPEGPADEGISEAMVRRALRAFRRGPAHEGEGDGEHKEQGKDEPGRGAADNAMLGFGLAGDSLASSSQWMEEEDLPADGVGEEREQGARGAGTDGGSLPSLPSLAAGPVAIATTVSVLQQMDSLPSMGSVGAAAGAGVGGHGSQATGRVQGEGHSSAATRGAAEGEPLSRDALDRWLEQATDGMLVPGEKRSGKRPVGLPGLRAGSQTGPGGYAQMLPATPIGNAGRQVLEGSHGPVGAWGRRKEGPTASLQRLQTEPGQEKRSKASFSPRLAVTPMRG